MPVRDHMSNEIARRNERGFEVSWHKPSKWWRKQIDVGLELVIDGYHRPISE